MIKKRGCAKKRKRSEIGSQVSVRSDFRKKDREEVREVSPRGTSILGEVRNVEISRVTQQLLCSKSHDFLAIFALAHSKINQIA